jgi:hypothetical protein
MACTRKKLMIIIQRMNLHGNMEEAVGFTTPGGAKIYIPKYIPSLLGFAEYHFPRNAYGLGLDGTAYTSVTSRTDFGGTVYSTQGRTLNPIRVEAAQEDWSKGLKRFLSIHYSSTVIVIITILILSLNS